nr:hypothetical protein [Theobroma cacao]
MTFRTTEASQIYQEVLQAVDPIQPPAVGFVAPSATVSSALQTVIKQNNSIIQYLATIHNRLDDLESQISQLQQKSPRPASSQIEALTRQLSQLDLSAIEKIPKQTVRKAQGPYFVFKDPKRIFNDVVGNAPQSSSNQSKGKAVATSSESKDETQQQQ